jgi:hypothetical protein
LLPEPFVKKLKTIKKNFKKASPAGDEVLQSGIG